MKTKSIHIQLTICCFFLVIFSGCDLHLFEYPEIYQFTSDDLSLIYFDQDTLIYDIEKDEEINYSDTIRFLYNSKDTCNAIVSTRFYSIVNVFLGAKNFLWGESWVSFKNSGKFNWAEIDIIKKYNDEVTLRIQSNGYYFAESSYQLKFDTALVLNNLYTDVIKFYPSKEDSTEFLKSIFLAKKFGIILMESTEGDKIELINDLK
jgi:hypothetical protein